MNSRKGCVYYACVFLMRLCMYPLVLLTYFVRGAMRGFNRARILSSMTQEQCALLKSFAVASKEVQRLEDLFFAKVITDEYVREMDDQLFEAVLKEARLAHRCEAIGILEEEISVFRAITYNCWWWDFFNTQWWSRKTSDDYSEDFS